MKRHRADTFHSPFSRILSIVAGIAILVMCGCETGRESKSGRWKAVRRADWDATLLRCIFYRRRIPDGR